MIFLSLSLNQYSDNYSPILMNFEERLEPGKEAKRDGNGNNEERQRQRERDDEVVYDERGLG